MNQFSILLLLKLLENGRKNVHDSIENYYKSTKKSATTKRNEPFRLCNDILYLYLLENKAKDV